MEASHKKPAERIIKSEKENETIMFSKLGSIRTFVILTNLLFWVLFSITGLTVFLETPEIVQTVMKNICAWSSTIVLLIWFKKFYPNETLKGYLRRQFQKTTFQNFAIPTLIQILLVTLATVIFFYVNGEPLGNIKLIKISAVFPMLLIFITSGPMGQELGWRGFALNEFQKKYSPLVSALFIGVLWGFWHFPLWLITGFAGYDLLLYSASFMLGIVSFSVFLTYFYNKKKNIVVAVWMHFLFNVLLQIVIIEDYKFILLLSTLYLISSVCIVLIKRKEMFSVQPQETKQSLQPELGGLAALKN